MWCVVSEGTGRELGTKLSLWGEGDKKLAFERRLQAFLVDECRPFEPFLRGVFEVKLTAFGGLDPARGLRPRVLMALRALVGLTADSATLSSA